MWFSTTEPGFESPYRYQSPQSFPMRLAALIGVFALVGVLAGLGAAPTSFGVSLENATYDARLRATARPGTARPDIALVEINDSSIAALEPVFGRWPWPRVVHASIIDFLARAGAKAIAYDVLFLEADTRSAFPAGDRTLTGAASDQALAESIRRAGNVVLLADATYQGLASGADAAALVPPALPGRTWPVAGFPAAPSLRLPLPAFAAGAAAVGHNALIHDEHDRGTVRSLTPFLSVGPLSVPSLGVAAALVAGHTPPAAVGREGDALRLGAMRVPLRHGTRTLVAYRGPYIRTEGDRQVPLYPTVPAVDVLISEDRLASGAVPPVDPAIFKDKIVFVGVGAAGLFDVVVTPFRGAGSTPGVFLHAAAADDVLSGRGIHPPARGVTRALTIAAGLAAGLAAFLLPVWVALAAIVAVWAAAAAWLVAAFGGGRWIEAVPPTVALVVTFFAGTAWNYFVEGRERRRVRRLFGRYVSPRVIAELEANPALASLGGARREMSVLFADIRGFTAASERTSPEAVVAQLNEYFTAMVGVLHAHHGTLDKFVGDLVMGLFGAPLADPHHADHAVACARAMLTELGRLNARWTAEGRPTLEIGIGVNSGEMIAGNIGADTLMSYTVIGDAVNLASRLESLTKDQGVRIIISGATRHRLQSTAGLRPLGQATVKGRTEAVEIWAVETAN